MNLKKLTDNKWIGVLKTFLLMFFVMALTISLNYYFGLDWFTSWSMALTIAGIVAGKEVIEEIKNAEFLIIARNVIIFLYEIYRSEGKIEVDIDTVTKVIKVVSTATNESNKK